MTNDYGEIEESGAERIAPPRPAVVGGMIAIPHAGCFFGPYRIHAVTPTSIEVVTKEATMERYQFTLTWPEGDGVEPHVSIQRNKQPDITVLHDYETDWVFADDPRVKYPTELERQVLAAKLMRLANPANPWTVRQGNDAPVCRNCNSWGCKKLNDCPDYALIAQGRTWNREEHRMHSLEEMAVLFTCGNRKTVAVPTMVERVKETMTKRKAA